MVDRCDDDLTADGRRIRAGIFFQDPVAHGDVRGRAAEGFDGFLDHFPDRWFCLGFHWLVVLTLSLVVRLEYLRHSASIDHGCLLRSATIAALTVANSPSSASVRFARPSSNLDCSRSAEIS